MFKVTVLSKRNFQFNLKLVPQIINLFRQGSRTNILLKEVDTGSFVYRIVIVCRLLDLEFKKF